MRINNEHTATAGIELKMHNNTDVRRKILILFYINTILQQRNCCTFHIHIIFRNDSRDIIQRKEYYTMGGNNSKLDHLNDSRDVMMIRDERNNAKNGNSQKLEYVPRRHVTKSGSATTTKKSASQKKGA